MAVRITVRKNRIPAVVSALREIEKKVTESAGQDLTGQLKDGASSVWGSKHIPAATGILGGRPAGHVTVGVGLNRGRGFYSRFLEWGTVNNKARPMVTQKAHNFEPTFMKIARDEVRKACGAK